MLTKEEIAAEIKDGFSEAPGVDAPYAKILGALEHLKKLGVTNQFIEDIEIHDKRYLIRINGALWPPYTRDTEASSLASLKQIGLDTNVLFNGVEFQICKQPNKEHTLASLLSKGSESDIRAALTLIAKEIAKYQKVQGEMIKYPLSKMLNDAMLAVSMKLSAHHDVLDTLQSFSETCQKIITVLNNYSQGEVFSHCDLDATSVYVDLPHSKVTIVDWEYSASSYWSNDLAMLGRFLTDDQFDYFSKVYFSHAALDESVDQLPKDLLQFNKFILKFFYDVVWKINSHNVQEFKVLLDEMRRESGSFMGALDDKLKSAPKALTMPDKEGTPSIVATGDPTVTTEYREVMQAMRHEPEDGTPVVKYG